MVNKKGKGGGIHSWAIPQRGRSHRDEANNSKVQGGETKGKKK